MNGGVGGWPSASLPLHAWAVAELSGSRRELSFVHLAGRGRAMRGVIDLAAHLVGRLCCWR